MFKWVKNFFCFYCIKQQQKKEIEIIYKEIAKEEDHI